MASRIRQEELQQEETNSVKNPPRKITARRNQWRQESAEKNYSKNIPMASRIRQEELQQEESNGVKNPPRRNSKKKPSPGGGVVFETSGPALIVSKNAVDD